MTIEEALRKHWGYDSFKPLQREAVQTALSGRDCMVVLATGGGKSLCYQLPAAMGEGLVLVISPLIALMDDQVAAAREAGLSADALHSNMNADQKSKAFRRLAEEQTQLLYVSPERLLSGDLNRYISPRLILAAVDEAHCVSHWGHEFRPEYRRLTQALDCFPKAARMALTATATPEVQKDICSQLDLREPLRFIGHPDRANLIYRAFQRTDQSDQVLAVARRHKGEGGIVYAQTRRETERLAGMLQKAGISCAAYHAGMPAEDRRRVQDEFVNERLDVVTATIAFGMGIDRSNVRFIVHANTPRSIEHYQQESGRAGRDGLPAECVLLFSASDLAVHRRLAQKDADLSPERQQTLNRQLCEIGRYASSPVCRHRLLAGHFGAPYPPENANQAQDNCGACDVCMGETKSLPPDETLLTAKKVLSAAWRAEGRFGTGYVVNLLIGKADERMENSGHDKLKVFGLLKDSGETTVRSWVDQLIVQGFLEVTEGQYPLLRITKEGKALCREQGTVRLSAALPPRLKAKKKSRTKMPESVMPADMDVFENLRKLRRLIAEKLEVPPYVIFHDSALAEMSSAKPHTPEDMGNVKGVGEHKLKHYGDAFLKVIAGAHPESAAKDFTKPTD